MIAHIEGVISEKVPTQVIVDVNGIGYEVLIPFSTFEQLPDVGNRVKILTYQHVREDSLLLFGFMSKKEKWMFTRLISVSGIGPKSALGVLSGCKVDDLIRYILNGEIDRLSELPGIGKKTAQRLNLELKDKLGTAASESMGAPLADQTGKSKQEQAVLALVSLGFSRMEAEKKLINLLTKEPDLPLDELIKRALQKV